MFFFSSLLCNYTDVKISFIVTVCHQQLIHFCHYFKRKLNIILYNTDDYH